MHFWRYNSLSYSADPLVAQIRDIRVHQRKECFASKYVDKLCRQWICLLGVVVSVLALAVCGAIVLCKLGFFAVSRAENPVQTDGYVPMRDAMNLEVSPCEDFYEFACGNWDRVSKKAVAPPRMVTWYNEEALKAKFVVLKPQSTYPHLVNEAIKLFRQCNDMSKLKTNLEIVAEEAKDMLNSFGGWPFLGDVYWSEKNFTLEKFLGSTMRYGFKPLFDWDIIIDRHNSLLSHLYFQGATYSHKLSNPSNQEILQYVLKLLNQVPLSNEQFQKDIESVIDLQQTINKLTNRHIRINSDSQPLRVIQKTISEVHWTEIMEIMATNHFLDTAKVSGETVIMLRNPATTKYLLEVAKKADKRVLANLMGWNIVRSIYAEYIGIRVNHMTSRCYHFVREEAVPALNYVFLHLNNPESVNDEIPKEIVTYINKTFIDKVKMSAHAHWLGMMKPFVIEKITKMFGTIWFDDFYKNKHNFENVYGKIPVVKGNDFVKTWLSMRYFLKGLDIHESLVSIPREKRIANYKFQEVNGIYNYHTNSYILPLANRYRPMYFVDGPQYLNFGAFGFHVGHLISHAFDELSRNFDALGQLQKNETWPKAILHNYRRKMNCFKSWYSRFKIRGTSLSVNGRKVADNAKGDAMALRIAIFAYQTWIKDKGIEERLKGLEQFNPYQLLYISFAQQHCSGARIEDELKKDEIHAPNYFRVLGTIQTSMEFPSVFNCKVGTPMNPFEKQYKCRIW